MIIAKHTRIHSMLEGDKCYGVRYIKGVLAGMPETVDMEVLNKGMILA